MLDDDSITSTRTPDAYLDRLTLNYMRCRNEKDQLLSENDELQSQNHRLVCHVRVLEQKNERTLALALLMTFLLLICVMKEVNSIRESNQRLVSDNTNLRASCDSVVSKHAMLQKDAEQNIHDLMRKVDKLTLENERIVMEAEQCRVYTLEESEGVVNEMQDNLDDMQNKLIKVQDDLERKHRENQCLRDEIEFCKKTKDQEIRHLKDQVNFYRTESNREKLLLTAQGKSSVIPGRQPTSVTPAPSKRDKSRSVNSESLPSKSPMKKRAKTMTHENAHPEPCADAGSTTNDSHTFQFNVQPAGTLVLEEGEKAFVKTSWNNVAEGVPFKRDENGEVGYGLLTREGPIGEMDKKLADEVIGNYLVCLFFVNPILGGVMCCGWYIARMLTHMMNSMRVFVVYYARGAASSGWDAKRLYNILKEEYGYFRTIIQKIEENYVIMRLGMIWNESGKHDWHSDSFQRRTDYRGILSLLSSNKIMWFRDTVTGAQFGITVPHSAFIFLTRYGSGAEGSLEHKITGADNSAILVFDCAKKDST